MSKPWWRWWRKRRKNLKGLTPVKVLSFTALLIAADLFTKKVLHTPDWAWHDKAANPRMYIGFAILALLCIWMPRMMWGTAFFVAAYVGNILMPKPIANPFIVSMNDLYVAFNMADMYLIVGTVVLIAVAATNPL